MTIRFMRHALLPLFALALLLLAGCASTPDAAEEPEPEFVGNDLLSHDEKEALANESPSKEEAPAEEEEPPLTVAESEPQSTSPDKIKDEVIVTGRIPQRYEVISNHVTEAKALLRDVELQYVFIGKGRSETLRGRPVAFALWSEVKRNWTIVHIEIPRPPVRWRPGGRPIDFRVLTPGIEARHIKGTGAERLMFAFSRNGEPLKVYGRKFPVFDNTLIKRKQWRAVAETARPIIYLPFTEDTLDPQLVSGGKDYLLSTARKAIDELRLAKAPSMAFPGELLADIVPAEVITTLAVIEQTDDTDFIRKKREAVDEVLNHYGLKRDEAFRYSVSKADALGPMQFTNRRGNGTYALVVRRCPAANIDPNFERGATNLLNSMKAAICLIDMDLSTMRDDIRDAYQDNKQVLGIFPVASYNGGGRNVNKLYKVMKKMKLKLEELTRPVETTLFRNVNCPCLWKATATGVMPVAIPRYNRENRGYIEKYQSILKVFE
ncbi:MAG TPA: hypothetical protein VHL14_09500 [Steroidobacteraceae bacterium]|nr:hypothetical protein [Steroidobacteraceae bacterium]